VYNIYVNVQTFGCFKIENLGLYITEWRTVNILGGYSKKAVGRNIIGKIFFLTHRKTILVKPTPKWFFCIKK
jgi:hypothetical protein